MSLLLSFWLACAPGPAPSATSAEPPAGSPRGPAGEQVSAEPAEAPEPVPDTIALRHILLSFTGSATRSNISRSKAEAERELSAIRARAVAGEDFAELAKESSEDMGSRRRGGWLGAASQEAYVPAFSEAAWQLQVGDISPIVETEFGLHLIKREALEQVHLQQILVQHADVPGVWRSDKDLNRSRAEAKGRADAALQALDAGAPFSQVAKEYSDGPMAPYGGDLGEFLTGELGPAFDQQVDALEPGQRSAVFETEAGFHILERLP